MYKQLDLFGEVPEKPVTPLEPTGSEDVSLTAVPNEVADNAPPEEPIIAPDAEVQEMLEEVPEAVQLSFDVVYDAEPEENIQIKEASPIIFPEETITVSEPITVIAEPITVIENISISFPNIIEEPADEILVSEPEIIIVSAPKKGKRGRKSQKEMEAEAAAIEIPPDDVLFKKQYYSIGEVSRMFKLNSSLLRYWESEFDIIKPRKNRKGDRHFRPEDIKNLYLIHHLLRGRKYTIEGAKTYLKKNKNKASEQFEIIQKLDKVKQFLLELKAGL